MRIQPRQELIELWKSAMAAVVRDGKWSWGGSLGRNSISDAEQLLCLMYPVGVIPFLRIDRPDETSEDVLEALSPLGDALEIPTRITEILIDYMQEYADETGAPMFGSGGYFRSWEQDQEPSDEQRSLEVVDAYSMSVTLTLHTIGFTKVLRGVVRGAVLLKRLDLLEELASRRLTAALVGLLRSFTINVFSPESGPGRHLTRALNQAGGNPRQVIEDLRAALGEVRASVRDFTIGSGQTSELDDSGRLFEVGWSWGIVKDAPEIDGVEDIGKQRTGVAPAVPMLYFTVNALDGISDLFSPRTVDLRLLDETQQGLAQALRLRWQLTQKYWGTIATFGEARWPLEDLPWKTTDGVESDYYSLLVASMVVQDLETRSRTTDDKLRRLGGVLQKLADRGRITDRPTENDPAIFYHSPGFPMRLVDSDAHGGPELRWDVSDYSAVIMKRTIRLAGMARSTELRDELIGFGDRLWTHLGRRRLPEGPATGLWDRPANLYEGLPPRGPLPTWYFTERIVECLVFATQLITDAPVQSQRLAEFARDLLNEADHLHDYEVLRGQAARGGRLKAELERAHNSLVHAREIIGRQPGTAASLALDVLRFLDTLEVARKDAARRTTTETI